MFEEFSEELIDHPEANDHPESEEIAEGESMKKSFHIQETNNPDMPEVVIGGVPELWAETMDSYQGDNEYGIRQCCGLVSTSNLFQMAGMDLTEDDVVEYALGNNRCIIDWFDWSESGGTEKEDVEAILESHGIEAETYEAFEVDYEEMAGWIEGGQGVILGHNAYLTMEGMEDYASTNAYGQLFADHYVAMTGTVRDLDGNLLGYTVCDSGFHDGMRFISLDQMDAGFKDVFYGDVIVTSEPIHEDGRPLYQA
ncbi:MAG: hypothetical protein LUI87_10815 [Lachnospiraceae bacterium]|nr:hypothetical protein [Lachnospiraceae bacterium]